jgi:serine/threonine-protein kinase 24/25/MST4
LRSVWAGGMADEDAKENSVAEILSQLVEQFQLSPAQAKYTAKDLQDVMDEPEIHRPALIKNITDELASAEYRLMEKIGSGGFGHVFLGRRRKDNELFAIKVIDLEQTSDDVKSINAEIMALVNGQVCPQLINYYGSCMFGSKVWIVMEFVDGGSLLDRMKKLGRHLTEAEIAIVCREVLLGLQFLSGDGKIHRDVKAANILLSSTGQVKLADFGATGQLTDTFTKCNSVVGSPYWMAPEIPLGSPYNGKADVWSLGITCFELACGRTPNSEVHPMQVLMLIPKKPAPQLLAFVKDASPDFVSFVNSCLQKDPDQRASVSDLLRTPFIKSAGQVQQLAELVR